MSELKQTDLSKRLRDLVTEADRNPAIAPLSAVLGQAADEIERYYTGMLNWKATAEAQSTQPEATKPAQDLGAAILALPLPNTTLTAEVAGYKVSVYGAQHMRDFAMAAAALASPADALVAGDRVDTLQEIATKLRRAGADIPAPQHDDAIKGATINGLSIALLLVDEAIQAQKDGHGHG